MQLPMRPSSGEKRYRKPMTLAAAARDAAPHLRETTGMTEDMGKVTQSHPNRSRRPKTNAYVPPSPIKGIGLQ